VADTGSTRSDPFADVISLVAGPIAAVIRSFDQLRKGADELMRGLENFNTTMTNLNETAQRVNRLLNDFEEPVRAMLPQIRRTVDAAESISTRLSKPVDEVIPGLNRLAETLNSPVLTSLPADLGEFMSVINDLSRRLGPLGQFAEHASNLFGLRLPSRPEPPTPPPATPATPAPAAAPAKTPARKRTPAKKKPPAS
jgi:ABC-type transporter Mla subunit MlaD